MKLLIVANYAKEHVNKFHLQTIKKFKTEGWTVDVACNADAEVPGADNVYHLPCERNPFRPATLKCIKKLKQIISENSYDVVHLHTLAGRIIGTLSAKSFKKKGLKIVVTYHGLNYYKGSSLLSKMLIPLDAYLSRFSDLSFSDNKEDIHYGQKHGLKMKNCIFCPPPVKEEKFLPIAHHKEKRENIRSELGLSNENILITYVAELTENKNQGYLLRMLSLLKKTVPNAKLMLVGPEHDSGATRSEAERLGVSGDVLFMGWRSDIADLLCASDIYVASSIREGFGINLIEAMLCELPVIATDNRGHREIVKHEENGLLVSFDSPEEFAFKTETLIKNISLREKLVIEANNTYEKLYSKSAENAIFEEYQKMLGI